MQKLTLKEVNPSLKEFYTRAVSGSRRDDYDYAISLLKALVQKAPGFIEAREKLREFELKKLEKVPQAGLGVAFKTMMRSGKIRKMIAENPLQALSACEDLLGYCINNTKVLKLMVEAAEAAEARFISIESLELLVKFNPANREFVNQLCDYYRAEERVEDIVKVYQQLALQFPNDMDLQMQLREATQAAGREKGRRSAEVDRDSITLQLEDGIIRDPGQARLLIDKYNSMLEENNSMDMRRKLANAYMVAGDFDAAARELETVAASLGNPDSQLDKLIEKAYLAKFDHAINLLQANPAAYENGEAQLASFIEQRRDFRFDRAQRRLKSYPNDATLHYDLGQLYYEYQQYDEALKEFEEAAKNPQRRAQAHLGIGRTMIAQRNYEAAVAPLQQGLSEMIRADRSKLEAMYDLAQVYEQLGEINKALDIYQEIMQNNIKFRDVKQQIERLTGK